MDSIRAFASPWNVPCFTAQPADLLVAVVLTGLAVAGLLVVFQKWNLPAWMRQRTGWYCEFCLAFWGGGVFWLLNGSGIFVTFALALASAMVAVLALKNLFS